MCTVRSDGCCYQLSVLLKTCDWWNGSIHCHLEVGPRSIWRVDLLYLLRILILLAQSSTCVVLLSLTCQMRLSSITRFESLFGPNWMCHCELSWPLMLQNCLRLAYRLLAIVIRTKLIVNLSPWMVVMKCIEMRSTVKFVSCWSFVVADLVGKIWSQHQPSLWWSEKPFV